MNNLGAPANIIALASLAAVACVKPAVAGGCHTLSRSSLENKAQSYQNSIRSAAQSNGVHEDLIKAVIAVESCFKSRARGTSGEKGLMQLMPGTAARFNVRSGYNAWENVHGGASYLRHLMRYYNGDTRRAIAAYNAGEGNVRPGGVIRNKEYVRKVMSAYSTLAGGGDAVYKHSRKSSISYKKRRTAKGYKYKYKAKTFKARKAKSLRYGKRHTWLKPHKRLARKASFKKSNRARASRLAKKYRSRARMQQSQQVPAKLQYAKAAPSTTSIALRPGDTVYTIVQTTYAFPVWNRPRAAR